MLRIGAGISPTHMLASSGSALAYTAAYAANDFDPALVANFSSDFYAAPQDVLGPELVANGTFDSDISGVSDASSTGGSIAWNASGYLDLVNATGTARAAIDDIPVEAGARYRVSYEVVDLGGSAGVPIYLDGAGSSSNAGSSVGVKSFDYVATGATLDMSIRNFGAGTTVSIDNVSVRKLTQIPAASDFETLFAATLEATSNGTMVDSDGVLKWRPHNLLTYSEDFSAADWSKVRSSVTANNTTAPDGTMTADRFTTTSTDFDGIVRQTFSHSSGSVYTFSLYAKAGDRDFVFFRDQSSGFARDTFFNLNLGTVATKDGDHTAFIEDVGNGWFRCSITFTAGNTDSTFISVLNSQDDDNTVSTAVGFIYLWGAQLHRSDLGGMADNPSQPAGFETYVPTTTAARYLPRLGHHKYDASVAQWNAHNLMFHSEDLTNAAWTKSAITITANDTTAPDGTLTADLVTKTGSDATTPAQTAIVASNGDTMRNRVWVKRSSGDNWVRLRFDAGAGSASAWVDIVNRTVGTVNTGVSNVTVADAGDGWTLVSADYTLNAGTVYGWGTSQVTSDGSMSATGQAFWMWGAHVYRTDLNGVVANSGNSLSGLYVPTTALTVPPTLNEVSFVNKGVLVESEARTNLFVQSDPNAADWLIFASRLTKSKDAVGPDGVANSATTLTNTIANFCKIGVNATVATSTAYTFSGFFKAGTLDWVLLYTAGFTTPAPGGVYFDLANGSVGTANTGYTGRIEDFGNGWYRCCMTFTTDASDTSGSCEIYPAEADGDISLPAIGETIAVYGLQFEAGSTPSSLIVTNGATVTRTADTNGMGIAAALMPAYTDAVSIAMKGEITYADENNQYQNAIFAWQNSGANRILNFIRTDGTYTGGYYPFVTSLAIQDEAPEASPGSYSPGVNVPFNVATRVTSTELQGAAEGAAFTANTTLTSIPDLSTTNFQLGNFFMGTIEQLVVWPVDIGDTGIEEASA